MSDLSSQILTAIAARERITSHVYGNYMLRLCEVHRKIVELCRAEIAYGTDGAVTAESVLQLLAGAYGIEEET